MTAIPSLPSACIPLLPTPQELIAGGLYKDLANSCFPGRHRKARALSPTARFARILLCAEGLSLSAGVARASGIEPRRDPRSDEPRFGQHLRAWPPGAQPKRP